MSQSDNSVFVIYRQGNFSVDEISQKLDLKPDKASESAGPDKNSVWKLFCNDKSLHLEEQIESWLNLLLGKEDLLDELQKDGWTIELDCLIQPNDGAAVFGLEPKILKELSNLHTNLIIRFWN